MDFILPLAFHTICEYVALRANTIQFTLLFSERNTGVSNSLCSRFHLRGAQYSIGARTNSSEH
jgi:hypothetical protein